MEDISFIQKQIFDLDRLFLTELIKCKDDCFIDNLERILNLFLKQVNNFHTKKEVAETVYDAPAVVRLLKKICKEVISISTSYNEGDLLNMYGIVNRCFKRTYNNIAHSTFFPVSSVTQNEYWYRIRKDCEKDEVKRKDLFHVPFEIRNKVGTYRYSVPGYPALYLGHSLYVSWLEMDCPASFHYSKFKIDSAEINVFDFRFFPSINSVKQGVNYLLSYPYKLACSLPATKKSNFVPEYLFPQLMIHAILRQKKSSNVNGLLYSSTKAFSILNENNCRDYDNLVLPAINMKREGYCDALQEMISLSIPQRIEVNKLLKKDAFDNKDKEHHHKFRKI